MPCPPHGGYGPTGLEGRFREDRIKDDHIFVEDSVAGVAGWNVSLQKGEGRVVATEAWNTRVHDWLDIWSSPTWQHCLAVTGELLQAGAGGAAARLRRAR